MGRFASSGKKEGAEGVGVGLGRFRRCRSVMGIMHRFMCFISNS
jgi:hypothetical protein